MRTTNLRAVLCAATVVLVAAWFSLGCGGGGSPTAPAPDMSAEAASAEAFGEGGRVLWGMWEVTVGPGGCEVTPLRGAMFNCNVVRFLQPPNAPVHLLTVTLNPGSDLTTGYLDLDVTLRHPFPGLSKFRGFDVRGIVMGDGSAPFRFDPTALRAGPTDLAMENADGWTRWWNPAEFTSYGMILGYTQGAKATPGYLASATINPYKYFADELDRDAPVWDVNLDGRGSFSVDPGVNTRQYLLQFPMTPVGPIYRFNYAIDASWALPSEDFAPDYPVEAFPPEANTQEAWLAVIDDEGTTAWYVNENANGGTVRLSVEVFDWQGAGQPSGVAGEVAALLVDCPLLHVPIDLIPLATADPAGPGSSVWTAEIDDLNLTGAGAFDCWVAIEADNPTNYAPQIQGDPFAFDWPDVPLRAYAYGTVEVSPFFPSDAPEVYEVIPPEGAQSTVVSDVQIIGANFQDGATVDFSYDPVTFLDVSDVQWVNESVITCDVDCAGPLGFYDVTVTNPDTQQGTLEDGFEVIEVAEQVWWASHMYNVVNLGRNPTVPGADPEALVELWTSPVDGAKKYCTPVVADGKIIFTGNDTFWANASMKVHCFDLYTGEEMWSHPIFPTDPNDNRAFSGPVWWAGPDGIERVAVGGERVYCYDANTGEELWTFDDAPDGRDLDWVSNQFQEYEGLVLARARQAHLYVLDFVTGAVVSHVECTESAEGGCGAKDGLVYISSNHYIECADIFTGELVWSTLLPFDNQITHWVCPTIVDDRCYFSTYQGYVFCVAIEGNPTYAPGEIIWSWHDPDFPAGSNPFVGGTAVVGDKIFVAPAFNNNHVYCIEDQGDQGVMLWRSSTTGYFDASPVWSSAPSYPEGVVYCPDRNGYIRAYDVADGSEVWALNTGGELRAGMSPIFDMLVVASGTEVTVFQAP